MPPTQISSHLKPKLLCAHHTFPWEECHPRATQGMCGWGGSRSYPQVTQPQPKEAKANSGQVSPEVEMSRCFFSAHL